MDMMYSAGYRCSHYTGMFRLDHPATHGPRAPWAVRPAPQPWLSPCPRDSNPVCLASPSAAPSAARKSSVDFHNLARDLESRPGLSESATRGHLVSRGRAGAAAGLGPTQGLARPRAQRGPERGAQKDEHAWKRVAKGEKLEASSPDKRGLPSTRQTLAVWMNNSGIIGRGVNIGGVNIGGVDGNSARDDRSERRTPVGTTNPNPPDASSRGDVLDTSNNIVGGQHKSVVGGRHKSAFSPPAKSEHRRPSSSHFMVSELLKTTTASPVAAAARGGPAFIYADCGPSWSKPLVARPVARPSPPLALPPAGGPGGLGLPPQNWCAKCNVSFRLTSDLVYHMRSHHRCERSAEPQAKRRREERLRCQVCAESFRERHHLSRHMISHN